MPNGVLSLNIGNGNASYAMSQVTASNVVVQNQWHYVEFNYDHTASHGTRGMIFVDGVASGTQPNGTNTYSSGAAYAAKPRIGRYPSTSDFSWIGQLQELIIYRGVAINRANYTPPTGQFSVS